MALTMQKSPRNPDDFPTIQLFLLGTFIHHCIPSYHNHIPLPGILCLAAFQPNTHPAPSLLFSHAY